MPMRVCTICGSEDDREYMYTCRDCGEWYCEDCNGWSDEYGACENGHCRDCCGCGRSRSRSVHDYTYRPMYMPKGNRGNTFMGVELEVHGSSDDIVPVVKTIDPSEDHLYMKRDSSIRGVEIVTHPMTLEFARTYPFPDLLRGLRNAGCETYTNYGLHIHVDRGAFRMHPQPRRADPYHGDRKPQSDAHQMMWLLFLYRNARQLEKLARRVEEHYAPFGKPGKGELKNKAKGSRSGERYVAVNCQNRATLELRFFKSTLNEREFYAALEFADASVKYTRDMTAADVLKGRALSWERFSRWAQRHNYKNLYQEIRHS